MSYLTSHLGQEEHEETDANSEDSAAETIEAVTKLTQAITEPAAKAYVIHAQTEINEERIKAGLPPLRPAGSVPPPPPPEKENFAIGGIALLIIIFLVLFKS
jgi:hypothetical protein